MANPPKRPKLNINFTTKPALVMPAYLIESCWIGKGWLGHASTGVFRRFVQHRNHLGIIRYYTYTNFSETKRDKGTLHQVVRGFRKVRRMTKQELVKHFHNL